MRRKGISPFVSTLMLIAITLALGAFLYTQFKQMVVSQVRTASLTVMDSTVASDGQTFTVLIKNDGNIPITIRNVIVFYNNVNQSIIPTFLSGSSNLQPGEEASIQFRISVSIQPFSSYTLTVVSDKVAKSFVFQA
jgi:flagellin-like protein